MCEACIRTILSISSVAFALAAPARASEPPEVTNVVAEQREETMLVDVYYDLYDPDGDSMTVWLLAFDGIGTFRDAVPIMSGLEASDIGAGITTGQSKHIVWDAGAQYPNQSSCEYEVLVYACDDPGCNKSEAYAILGVVREGALAYFSQNLTYTGGTLALFGAQDEVDEAVCFEYSLTGQSEMGFTCTATERGTWGPDGAYITYTRWGADGSVGDPGIGTFNEVGW
jgi:hypothetical protein